MIKITEQKAAELIGELFQESEDFENPNPERLVFIEVQYGNYFGEDDIIRINDKYGRV